MMRDPDATPQRVPSMRRGTYMTPATVWDVACLGLIVALLLGPAWVAITITVLGTLYAAAYSIRGAWRDAV